MSDQLDLTRVTIHNSPNVASWAPTALITKMSFRPTGVHVEHSKNQGVGAWPDFRPAGWTDDLQYTLWVFLKINGEWHGSGCIQFWQSCDENGGPPEEFAKNWYYAADRWAPMTGYQAKPGEPVGFMVSAGDALNNAKVTLQERSNVIVIPFPASGGEYVNDNQPPPPPPDPPDWLVILTAISARLDTLSARADAQDILMSTLQQKLVPKMPIAWKGVAKLFGYTVNFVADKPVYTEPAVAPTQSLVTRISQWWRG